MKHPKIEKQTFNGNTMYFMRAPLLIDGVKYAGILQKTRKEVLDVWEHDKKYVIKD